MYRFLTTLAFFKLTNLLKTSWEYIQDFRCDFVYIKDQFYRLTLTRNYGLIINIKNTKAIEQHQTKWYKVGDVINLYTYPLLAGSEEEVLKCSLTHTGLIGMDDDSNFRNHMFVVYNGETKYIIQDNDNYIIRGINVMNLGDNKVMIQSIRTDYVIALDINEILKKSSATIRCVTTLCNQFLTPINCIDCGTEAASWISSCLKDGNLRLGYTVPETSQISFRNHIQQLNGKNQDERNIILPSSYLPVCTLISSPSRGWIGNKLYGPINSRDFRPNIVISTNSLYDLIEWEWIMIGNTILRNLRPWRRLETNLDGQNMPVNMMLCLLPLQCELYLSGQVQTGDGVYVKMPVGKTE